MNKLPVICTLMLLSFQAVAQNNNVIDEIVWIVGDEAIFKSEVEEQRHESQLRGVHWDGDPYCLIPEELAIQKLFINQAIIDSIDATPSEVSGEIDYNLQYMVNQAGSMEKLEEISGMREKDIRARMENNVRNNIIMRKMQSEITKNVSVTPADVRRYVKEMDISEIPFVPTQVEVQIITREPVIPQEEIDAVKAELRDYTERIQSGATTFSSLAILYSEDATSRQGGEVGFVGRAEVVPEFAAVAFNLTDPTKVSKIVETEYGFHIMQLIEKRGDRVNVRHILRKPKVPKSSVDESLRVLDSIADEIRNGRLGFDDAAMRLSADKETRNNRGIMAYHPKDANTSISRFEMQQLPQEVARAVDRMHVGEISDPFTMITSDGKQVCAIVRLKSRIDGHKANVAEDYQILQEIVADRKRDDVIQKWISEKQKTTYVKIFNGWNECEFRYPGWVIKE